MARDEKVMMRLDTDIKKRFQQIAEEKGLTMSSLGAYVIGSFVNEHDYKLKMQEKLAMSLGPEIMQYMKNNEQ